MYERKMTFYIASSCVDIGLYTSVVVEAIEQ